MSFSENRSPLSGHALEGTMTESIAGQGSAPAEVEARDQFIPVHKTDIIEALVGRGRLAGAQARRGKASSAACSHRSSTTSFSTGSRSCGTTISISTPTCRWTRAYTGGAHAPMTSWSTLWSQCSRAQTLRKFLAKKSIAPTRNATSCASKSMHRSTTTAKSGCSNAAIAAKPWKCANGGGSADAGSRRRSMKTSSSW